MALGVQVRGVVTGNDFICLLIPVLFPPYLNEFSLWHVSPNVLCSFLIGHVCCLLSVSPFYSLAPPACHL